MKDLAVNMVNIRKAIEKEGMIMADPDRYQSPWFAPVSVDGDSIFATNKDGKEFEFHLKDIETIQIIESDDHAVLPFPGDTGFAMIKKGYRRHLWTNKELYEASNSLDVPYLGEIPKAGSPDSDFVSNPVGYMNKGEEVPTDMFEDPDKVKKNKQEQLKHLSRFKNFDPTPKISDEHEKENI